LKEISFKKIRFPGKRKEFEWKGFRISHYGRYDSYLHSVAFAMDATSIVVYVWLPIFRSG
jgi:hypothetical protein